MKQLTREQVVEALNRKRVISESTFTSGNEVAHFIEVAKWALQNSNGPDGVPIFIEPSRNRVEYTIHSIEFTKEDKTLVLHLGFGRTHASIDTLEKFVKASKAAGLAKMSAADNIVGVVEHDESSRIQIDDIRLASIVCVVLDFGKIPTEEETIASIRKSKTAAFLSEKDA